MKRKFLFPIITMLMFAACKKKSKFIRIDKAAGKITTFSKLTVETDEQVVLDSYEDLIYPGSLIKGNSASNLNFIPVIGFNKKPITVSISIPAGKGLVRKEIINSDLSSTRTFLNEALNQSISGNQIASLSYDVNKFTSYDELKLSFGANVKIGTIFKEAFKDSTSCVSLKTGLIAKFVQRNFTLDMDIPKNGQLINGSVDPNIFEQYNPVYVSSISYGRLGIIAIESNDDYNDLYNAFTAAFAGVLVNDGVSITSRQKKIIDESQMNIYLRGGQGQEVAKSIKGYDEFLHYVINWGKFSTNTPGVPLFFRLRYLSDHSLFKTTFNVNLLSLGNRGSHPGG